MWGKVKKTSNRARQRQATRQIELAGLIIQQAREATRVLCAVLGQKGGEIRITEGTLAQVTPDMRYAVEPDPELPGELIVRLVLGEEAASEAASEPAQAPEPCSQEAHDAMRAAEFGREQAVIAEEDTHA